MAKINTSLSDVVSQWLQDFNALSLDVGNMNELSTTEDSDIVGALNSLKSEADSNENAFYSSVVSIIDSSEGLASIRTLDVTANAFLVGTDSAWVSKSGDSAISALGVTATGAELNLLDGINTSGNFGLVPSGAILMWSGSIGTIPSGWQICDGTNGTPNLLDRFIVGAGSTYAVDVTGGSNTVTLTESELPAHTHTEGNLANASAGTHRHGVYFGNVADGGGVKNEVRNASNSNPIANAGTTEAGAHTHTISGATASTGGGGAHENRPPYYALAYIMKL